MTTASVSTDNSYYWTIASLWPMPDAVLDVALYKQSVSKTTSIFASAKSDPALYLRWLSRLSRQRLLSVADLAQLQTSPSLHDIEQLQTLAGQCAIEYYFQKRSESQQSALRAYRQQALNCARVSLQLALHTAYPYPEEAYLAGLLHNVGQLSLLGTEGDAYADGLLSASSSVALEVFEKEWFNSSSVQLGSHMLRGLLQDSYLADALLFQLEPGESIADMPYLVRLLNIAVKNCDPSLQNQSLEAEAQSLLGISLSSFQKAQRAAHQAAVASSGSPVLSLVSDASKASESALEHSLRVNIGAYIKQLADSFILANGQRLSQAYPVPAADQEPLTAWSWGLQSLVAAYAFSSALILSYQPQTHRLQGVCAVLGRQPSTLSAALVRQLSYPLDGGFRVASQVLKAGQPQGFLLDEAQAHSGICDRHLCQLLNTERLLLVPMWSSQGEPLGVLIAAVSQGQLDELLAEKADLMARVRVVSEQVQQQLQPMVPTQAQTYDLWRQNLLSRTQAMDNPLTILHNTVEVLQLTLAKDEAAQGQLLTLRRQLEQVESLTGELRDSLQQVDTEAAVELGQYLRDRLAILQQHRPDFSQLRIDLRFETPASPLAIPSRQLDAICEPLLFWMCSRAAEFNPSAAAAGTRGIVELMTRTGINVGGQLFTRLCLRDYAAALTRNTLGALFSDPALNTDQRARIEAGLPVSVSLLQIKDQLLAVGGSISVENCEAGGLMLTLLLPESGEP